MRLKSADLDGSSQILCAVPEFVWGKLTVLMRHLTPRQLLPVMTFIYIFDGRARPPRASDLTLSAGTQDCAVDTSGEMQRSGLRQNTRPEMFRRLNNQRSETLSRSDGRSLWTVAQATGGS